MKTILDLIALHPFFNDLPAPYQTLIAGCGKNEQFKEGQILFKEGDPANFFYVIKEGTVSVELHVPGKGMLSLQTIGAGEILGWSWLFPPYEWAFGARAVSSTRVITLDGQCLRTKCDQDPAMGYALMKKFAKVMTKRLEATRLQLLDMYHIPTVGRL